MVFFLYWFFFFFNWLWPLWLLREFFNSIYQLLKYFYFWPWESKAQGNMYWLLCVIIHIEIMRERNNIINLVTMKCYKKILQLNMWFLNTWIAETASILFIFSLFHNLWFFWLVNNLYIINSIAFESLKFTHDVSPSHNSDTCT